MTSSRKNWGSGQNLLVLILSLLAALGASMVAAWAVSLAFGFHFDPSVVAITCVAAWSAAVVASWQRRRRTGPD